jgi:hypothetical protein
VQVPADYRAAWPIFIVGEVRPQSGLETKLLQAIVKKQVDFLLPVNFYS